VPAASRLIRTARKGLIIRAGLEAPASTRPATARSPRQALPGSPRQTTLVWPAVRLGLVRAFMIPASMIGCITLSSATLALAPLPARMAVWC
jgi:hypothetical protein